MHLTFIDPVRWGDRCGARRTRGTAEIETLLVVPVLLAILFLAGGAAKLGSARLANVFNAENDAYAQHMSTQQTLSISADIVPDAGPNAVRPGMPNRYAEARAIQDVTVPFGKTTHVKSILDRAVFLDPTWNYSGYPHAGDQAAAQEWFETYAAEDHPASLNTALGLRPAWTP